MCAGAGAGAAVPRLAPAECLAQLPAPGSLKAAAAHVGRQSTRVSRGTTDLAPLGEGPVQLVDGRYVLVGEVVSRGHEARENRVEHGHRGPGACLDLTDQLQVL